MKALEATLWTLLTLLSLLVAAGQYSALVNGEIEGLPNAIAAAVWPVLLVSGLAWFAALTVDDAHWMLRGRTVLRTSGESAALTFPGSLFAKSVTFCSSDLAQVSIEPGWWVVDHQWSFGHILLRRAANRGPLVIVYGLPAHELNQPVRPPDLAVTIEEFIGTTGVIRFGGTLPLGTAADVQKALLEAVECLVVNGTAQQRHRADGAR